MRETFRGQIFPGALTSISAKASSFRELPEIIALRLRNGIRLLSSPNEKQNPETNPPLLSSITTARFE